MSELINYNPDLTQRKIGVRESFESKCTSDNLDSVVDFTNVISIMKTSSGNNITREVGITGTLKFENCTIT
jgi:hypothetical protein